MKKVLIIFVLALCVTGCGCKRKNKDNYPKLPDTVNYDVSKKQTVDGIVFDNIAVIKNENGMTHVKAVISNSNKSNYNFKSADATFENKKGKKITTVGLIPSSGEDIKLKPNELKLIYGTTAKDLSKAVKVTFDIKN